MRQRFVNQKLGKRMSRKAELQKAKHDLSQARPVRSPRRSPMAPSEKPR